MDRKTETGADKHGFYGDMYMEEMVKIRWIFIQTQPVAQVVKFENFCNNFIVGPK
mgnify:CR=1 FL=1